MISHYYYHSHTALSFIGLVEFLFSRPEIKEQKLAFLSNNLCQDPLEQFFCCQWQRGGTSDNPNVLETEEMLSSSRQGEHHSPAKTTKKELT